MNKIQDNDITATASAPGASVVTCRTRVPGVIISVDLDASTKTTVVLSGIRPRGPISEPRTDEDGVTSINWSRVIAGTLHHFSRLVMPSGRVRFVVQRYTGHVDLHSPHAWTHRHFFTFPAPAQRDVDDEPLTVAGLVAAARADSPRRAVALRMAAMHLLGLTGRDLSDAVPTRGQREMLRAQVQVASSHPAYTPPADRAV